MQFQRPQRPSGIGRSGPWRTEFGGLARSEQNGLPLAPIRLKPGVAVLVGGLASGFMRPATMAIQAYGRRAPLRYQFQGPLTWRFDSPLTCRNSASGHRRHNAHFITNHFRAVPGASIKAKSSL